MISWVDGYVSLAQVKKNLTEILSNAGKIYVRGSEKLEFLSDLTIAELVDLESNDEYPSFEKLTWQDSYCSYNASKFNFFGFNCAVNNVSKLKFWLEKYQEKNN